MTSSYHSKVISTQNKGLTFFFCLKRNSSIVSPCLEEPKFLQLTLTRQSRRSQRLHENVKWVICVSNGVYTLFTETFLLLRVSLLKYFIHGRVKIDILDSPWWNNSWHAYQELDKVISVHLIRKRFFSFELFAAYPQEKSCLPN